MMFLKIVLSKIKVIKFGRRSSIWCWEEKILKLICIVWASVIVFFSEKTKISNYHYFDNCVSFQHFTYLCLIMFFLSWGFNNGSNLIFLNFIFSVFHFFVVIHLEIQTIWTHLKMFFHLKFSCPFIYCGFHGFTNVISNQIYPSETFEIKVKA